MAELFKFRCYQCQKLIGAPSSKFNAVVKCPRCGVELLVPSPDESDSPPPPDPDPETLAPEILGITIESNLSLRPKPTSSPNRGPDGPDPIAFLDRVVDPLELAHSEPSEATDGQPESDQDEPNLIEPGVEPLVPRGVRKGRSQFLDPAPRGRDVILPRTAAVAWALFAILALGFAFTSGLLIGHSLWK